MLILGGAEGDRTPGLRIANAALCQTELLPHVENEDTVSSFEFQVAENSVNKDEVCRTQRFFRLDYCSGGGDGAGLPARVAVKVPAPRPTTWTLPVI